MLRSQSSKFWQKQPWHFLAGQNNTFFEIPEYRSKGAAKNGWISCSPFTKTWNASGPFLGRIFKSLSTFLRRAPSAFTSSSSSVSSTECNLGNSFITSRSRHKFDRWRRKISLCLSSISSKFMQVLFTGQTTASQLFYAKSEVYLLSLLKRQCVSTFHLCLRI